MDQPVDTTQKEVSLYAAAGGILSEHIQGEPTERFEIEETPIGEGTYGMVRKCTHRIHGAHRAIRSVPLPLVDEAGIWNEIAVMRECDHPNVVKLYETFEDDEDLHMILELAAE